MALAAVSGSFSQWSRGAATKAPVGLEHPLTSVVAGSCSSLQVVCWQLPPCGTFVDPLRATWKLDSPGMGREKQCEQDGNHQARNKAIQLALLLRSVD